MISFGQRMWGLRGSSGFRTTVKLGGSGVAPPVVVLTGYGYNYGQDYGTA